MKVIKGLKEIYRKLSSYNRDKLLRANCKKTRKKR